MIGQGTELHVSEILGHSSIAITKDVYGHLVEGHKRSAAQSMTSVIMPRRAPEDAEIESEDGDTR